MHKLVGYVSPGQAAEILEVSRQYVWELVQRKRLDVLLTPLGGLIERNSLARLRRKRARARRAKNET